MLLQILTFLGLAATDPPAVEWQWVAEGSCPSSDAVNAAFVKLAPESCYVGGEPLEVEGVVVRLPGGWGLELEMRRGAESYERSLVAESCEALADAAVVIAVAACPSLADPELGAATTHEPSRPESEPLMAETVEFSPALSRPASGAEQDRPVTPKEPPVKPQRSGSRPTLTLGARAGMTWGPGPAPSILAGFTFDLLWPQIDVALGVDASPRRRASPTEPSIDVWVATTSLDACPMFSLARSKRVSMGPCAGLEAGAMFGTGVGTPRTRTRARPWVAGASGARLRGWVHSRVAVGVHGDVAASFTRPAFALKGFGFVTRARRLSARVRLFAEVRLW